MHVAEVCLFVSFQTAEEEKVLRELGLQVGEQSFDPSGIELEELERAPTANGR